MEGRIFRARPGRPRNVARRRTIVRAALELFAERGFEGTPMRAVGERAGIGQALAYRYYASKLELLEAVIAYVTEENEALYVRYCRAAQAHSSLREFLLEVGTAFSEHVARMHAWYALRLQRLPLDERQQRAILDAPERSLQTVARALAVRANFRDPYVTTRAFFGAIIYQQMLQLRLGLESATPALQKIFLEELISLLADGREAA